MLRSRLIKFCLYLLLTKTVCSIALAKSKVPSGLVRLLRLTSGVTVVAAPKARVAVIIKEALQNIVVKDKEQTNGLGCPDKMVHMKPFVIDNLNSIG
jgi:hypothetical protein